MTIRLCLFDLDNTLIRTNDLEDFRGAGNVRNTSAVYTRGLIAAFSGAELSSRLLYSRERLMHLRRSHPRMKWGVFTRSPRHYADTLLAQAYPGLAWDVVVAYEDVRNTKPHPDGVHLASRALGNIPVEEIALVGDEKVDVVTAYRAGCWAFIDKASWEAPYTYEQWWALERVPDAVFRGPDELSDLLAEPALGLPELEYLIEGRELPHRRSRIDKINRLFQRPWSGNVPVRVLGRLFGEYQEISGRRSRHVLTDQIIAHKDADIFPDEWAKCVMACVRRLAPFPPGAIVTVIPFKPDRKPRLERFLAHVEVLYQPPVRRGVISVAPEYTFIPDLLAFRPGVVSNHANHLTAQERFANVGDHLFVKRPHDVRGKRVIVLDDVVTSGATLLWAHRYLSEAGASEVTCLALAQAIGAT